MEDNENVLIDNILPEDADDELLLLQIYEAEQDPRQAGAALKALHERHAGFLEAVCEKYGWKHSAKSAVDFVNETFATVWLKKPGFRPPSSSSPDARRRAIRNFLCGICRNLYLRYLSTVSSIEGISLDTYLDNFGDSLPAVTIERLDSDGPRPTPPARTALAQYFDSLSEDNRFILTFSASYIDLNTGRCNMPHEKATQLASAVGLELATVRQRRKRMIDKMKGILADLPEEPLK